MSETLYKRDFYEWTREQGAALRTPGANNLDWENLAEEIEDLGSSQLATVFSYIRRIIEHLYKLADSENALPRNRWRREITTFRVNLMRPATRSILNQAEAELGQLHEEGCILAQASMDQYEPHITVDCSRRWTLDQIFGRADDPLKSEFRS